MAKSDKIDGTDAEKTGISSQVRVRDDPAFDPDVKLISQEQLERSAYVEKIGHAARHAELDERDPANRRLYVAGISALAVDDGGNNGKAS